MQQPAMHAGRSARRLRRTAAVVALLLASLVAAIVVGIESDWARQRIESIASRSVGRDVRIGALHVDWQLPLRIRVDGLTIGNAPWSSRPQMVQLEHASIEVRLLPLILGRGLVLPTVELRSPRIVLERAADRNNWTFEGDSTYVIPRIDRLSIDDGHVQYLEPDRRTDVRVATRSEGDGLALEATGRYGGEAVALKARTGGLGGLLGEDPYPVSVEGRVGATRVRAHGTVDPQKLERLTLQLELAGDGAADIGKLFGIAIPDSPPYKIAGKLTKRADVWRYEDFKGRVGDSDLAGFVQFDPRRGAAPGAKGPKGARPLLTGSLTSEKLDFNDLGPLVGAPPGTGRGQTASPRQRQQAARQQARGKVLPDAEFDTARWGLLDARFDFLAHRVLNSPGVPITRLQGTFDLREGAVSLKPFDVALAGGNLQGAVRLDGRAQPLAANLELRIAGLRMEQLVPALQKTRSTFGPLFGQVMLVSRGKSIDQLLGASDGSVQLVLAGGRISNLMVEAIGLDAGEVLKFLMRGDQKVDLRCAALALTVRRGLAQSEALVIDTGDSTIYGDGNVDLAREALGLTFHVKPKDRSILAVRAPLHLRGTFAQPKVGPDMGNLAMRSIAVLAMAAVNPLLTLLPTIETGPGRDSDCGRVLGQAPAWAREAAVKSSDSAAPKGGPDKALNVRESRQARGAERR